MNNNRVKIANVTNQEERVTFTEPTEVAFCSYKELRNLNEVYINNTTLQELYTSERSRTTIGDCLAGPKSKITTAYFHGIVDVFGGQFNKVIVGPCGYVQWSSGCIADEVIVSGNLVLNAGDAAKCIKHVVLNPGGKLICICGEVEKELNITTPDGTEPRHYNSWICG